MAETSLAGRRGTQHDEPCPHGYSEELVRAHMRLARALARRYADRGEELDDLVQVAYLGLVRAARDYRPGRGACFTSYAVPTITGELRKHFRDRGWDVRPPRRLQDLRARIRFAEDELRQRLQREPTEADLADELEVSACEVAEASRAAGAYRAVPLDAVPLDRATGGDDAGPFAGQFAGPFAGPSAGSLDGAAAGSVDAAEALRPLLAGLQPREQLILAMRFYGDRTQTEIAEQLGVTQMQVSRLLSQILGRLRGQALRDAA